MFHVAGTLTGDMEVHLPRHEAPGGTNKNYHLYNIPMSPGWGLKTTAERDYPFPYTDSHMVH